MEARNWLQTAKFALIRGSALSWSGVGHVCNLFALCSAQVMEDHVAGADVDLSGPLVEQPLASSQRGTRSRHGEALAANSKQKRDANRWRRVLFVSMKKGLLSICGR